jgi:K+-transporting ATPase c subunit
MATAEELRELADRVEHIQHLEREYDEARSAYEVDNTNPEKKERFRAAADAFAAARTAVREHPVSVVDTSPGSVTIFPAALGTTGKGA